MLIGSEQQAGGEGETGELMENSSRDRLMFFGSVTLILSVVEKLPATRSRHSLKGLQN
jgi:hypothetical protein